MWDKWEKVNYIKCSNPNTKNSVYTADFNKKKIIPITFNDQLKACFSNKKYKITIQTRPTHIGKSIFFVGKQIFNGLYPKTREYLTFNILLHIKS